MDYLNYIIQFNIVFSILLGIYHFTLRKNTDFRFNRIYLLAIAMLSILVPFIKIPVFGQANLLKFPLLNGDSLLTNMSNETSNFNGFLIQDLIAISYMLLSIVFMIALTIKLFKMHSRVQALKSDATFDAENNVFLLKDYAIPFTFLGWSFIPAALKHSKEKALIIAHERSHAKGLHSLDIIVAEVMKCLLFINPLNRHYKRYIAENHEYMADADAIKNDHESNYTDLLIKHALSHSHMSMASFFAKPIILNRINMMKPKKKNLTKMYVAVFTGLLFVTIMACDFQSEEEIVIVENDKNAPAKSTADLNSDEIFTVVEEQALPKEGNDGFFDFISQELESKYPKQAKSLGVEGTVYVQFTIEKDGSLSNITAVKGIGAGCDKVAVNAVAAYGNWVPGKQSGVVVRSQRVVPVRFILN